MIPAFFHAGKMVSGKPQPQGFGVLYHHCDFLQPQQAVAEGAEKTADDFAHENHHELTKYFINSVNTLEKG